jgi:hypothetical protein
MAKRESLEDKRKREEAEKKQRLAERQQNRRGKSTSAQRKADRDVNKAERRTEKQERLEEKAAGGDPFAQSRLEGQERATVTSEKLGRRSAAAKFRSSAYRKRQGLKNTDEDFNKLLKKEVAKAGFSGMDGGLGGGRRAVEALEDKQEAGRTVKKARATKKNARLEKVKAQEKRKQETKTKRFKQEVDSTYQKYKDNPELVERMMTEGTADLVDSYRELKRKKLNKNQFTKALESLRVEFNNTGGADKQEIYKLEDNNGELVLFSQDEEDVNEVLTKNTISPAMQKGMQKISGEFRREAIARVQDFEKSQQRLQLQEGAAVKREGRAEERGLAREERSEARQIAQEGRRTEARKAETDEERAFRTERSKESQQQSGKVANKKARAKKANELTKILGNDTLLNSRLKAYKKVYPDKSEAQIIEAMKRQIKKLRG